MSTSPKNEMEKVKASLEKMDSMSIPELRELETKYKEVFFPPEKFRNFALWNVVYVAATALYGWKLKTTATWLFPRKYYSFGELFKYGTLNAIGMTTVYLLGSCIFTDIWNPTERVKDLTHIQGKILDKLIVTNDSAQQYMLMDAMKYFGLSETLMDNAMQELQDNAAKEENSSNEYLTKKSDSP